MNPIHETVYQTLAAWADEPTLEKLGAHILGVRKASLTNAEVQTITKRINECLERKESLNRSDIHSLLEIEAMLTSFKPSGNWRIWERRLVSPTIKKIQDLTKELELRFAPFPDDLFRLITEFLPLEDIPKLQQVEGIVPPAALSRIWSRDNRRRFMEELNDKVERDLKRGTLPGLV